MTILLEHERADGIFGLRSALNYLSNEAERRRLSDQARVLTGALATYDAQIKPRTWPLLGVYPTLRKKPLDTFRYFADTPIVDLPMLPGITLTLVNDPEAIQAINADTSIVKSPLYGALEPILGRGVFMAADGKTAQAQRRPMINSLRCGLDELVGHVEAAADDAFVSWRKRGDFDLGEASQHYALDVIHRLLTGVPMPMEDCLSVRQALITCLDQANREAWALSPWLARRAGGQSRRAAASLREAVSRIVKRGTGPLLESLRAAHDDEGLIVDECANLLLAGHETTGAVLCFSLAFLSKYDDPNPDFDAVFNETLRLRPSVWVFSRVLTEPRVLAGKQLPKNRIIMVSPFSAHRALHWGDPDVFEPFRWEKLDVREETRAGRYFPFGLGARSCVGDRLARLETTALLERLVRSNGRGGREPALRVNVEASRIATSVTLRPEGVLARLD